MLKKIKNRYIKILSLTLLSLAFIACGGGSSSGGGGSSGGGSSSFSVTLVDGYIIDANVSDADGTKANQSKTDLGKYTFPTTPVGELSARGGVFVESNLSNLMSLKAPALSKVISPITTLLVDYPDLNSTLQNALNVTEEQLVGNFLSADDLNIAKLAQMVYGIYVNDLSNEFASLLDGSSPASLDDIFNIAKDVVNASSIVRKTDLLIFLEVVENYSGTTSALEVAIKDQKQKAQSDSPFEVSVIDGYIIDANVSDIDDELADKNESKAGYYNFRVSPYGELSARGGVFEANTSVSNHIVLKAPPLSRVISPITTLLVDYPSLNSILQSALDVTKNQLRGNFLSSNNLKIAKLAQVVYIIYKTDIVDEVNTSLTNNPPSNLDELIENISLVADEHITDNDIRANTLLFLDKVKTYDSSTDELEVFISPYKSAVQGEGPSLINYWTKAYEGSSYDVANSIIQTQDGGYAVAGYTSSFGAEGYDFWVVKLNSEGNIEWQKAYGGNGNDVANSIIQTQDGGYAVAGYTSSFGAEGYDFWVLKLLSSGRTEWQNAYGGNGDDRGYSVIQIHDGSYIVSGDTSSFGVEDHVFLILKINVFGDIVWQKALGKYNKELEPIIIQTSDGGYAVAGWTNSVARTYYNAWVLKLTSSGGIQWARIYTTKDDSSNELVYSIIQTTDGGYIIAGQTILFGTKNSNFLVLKLDSDGLPIWRRTYGIDETNVANSIIQTSDGGYAVAGYTNLLEAGNYNIWVLKLNSDGNIEWQKAYGGNCDGIANSIIQTSDGGYAVAGSIDSFGIGPNNSSFWVLKLSSDGYMLFRPTSGAKVTNTISKTTMTDSIPTTSIAIESWNTSISTHYTGAIVTDINTTVLSQAP